MSVTEKRIIAKEFYMHVCLKLVEKSLLAPDPLPRKQQSAVFDVFSPVSQLVKSVVRKYSV